MNWSEEELKWAEICTLLFEINGYWGTIDWRENFNRLEELGYTHDLEGNNLKEFYEKRYQLFDESTARENTFRGALEAEALTAFHHLKKLINDPNKLEEIIEELDLPFDADE
jgi:hypothetical protein